MSTTPPVHVSAPTFELHHSGFGVHSSRPRISWKFSCPGDKVLDWRQYAYNLEIANSFGGDAQSYHVEGVKSSLVPWPADCGSLSSRERRRVRVRCYARFNDHEGNDCDGITDWSSWGLVEAALFDQSDWIAHMITIANPLPFNDDGSLKPLRFQKLFNLPDGATIAKARLYATSHGVYHAILNGKAVGDQCMTPGWQSYHKRLHYQIYDVADLLRPLSENVIEFDVGPGWFASALTTTNQRFFYGSTLGILAQLEVTLQPDSGESVGVWLETIGTDETWSCTQSPILSSEIYNGEVFDQQCEYDLKNDTQPRRASQKTRVSEVKVGQLVSPNTPPVRVTQGLTPKSISKSASGKTIIDFGLNIVGRLRVTGITDISHQWKSSGHRITFRHAEVMQGNELYTRPLRGAQATDTIICNGRRFTDWTPKFTFHGFRYVEVEGWSPDDIDSPLTTDSIVAEVLHTDMKRTGEFICSDEEVNNLHRNAVSSMQGNFLSVPTDCPQRDDREGWTGDINIFMSSANFLYDTAGMLGNWLEDLYADQMEESKHWRNGVVPLVVPNCFLKKVTDDPLSDGQWGWTPMPNGIWSDAAIMVPWELFRSTGDAAILGRQYGSMVQYLENGVPRGEDGLWHPDQWQFGDWLDPTAPVNSSGQTRTDGTFVADCFLIQSTRLMVSIANVLQQDADAKHYAEAYHRLLSAFQQKYVTPSGLILPDTPTAMTLAITFQLVPPTSITAVATRLRRALRFLDFRIPTGFAGTAHLLHALTQTCQPSVAYTMLLSRAIPSLLYPVRMGATTIWERWDALKPDGTVNEGSMTSFNHYALGAVVSWLYECVGGIKILTPYNGDGERNARIKVEDEDSEHQFETPREPPLTFLMQPQVHHAMRYAKATYDSRCGLAECKQWFTRGATYQTGKAEEEVVVEVFIPPNAVAWVVLPRISSWKVGASQWRDFQGQRLR